MFIFMKKKMTVVVKVQAKHIWMHPSLPNVMSAMFKALW